MNGSEPSHEMIPSECRLYISLGGMLPSSATEAKAILIFLAVINIITSPVTVALNALVIIAVKMKSRLRAHKSNILLACLATTDLTVGVILQPMFAALMITMVLGETTAGSCTLHVLVPHSASFLFRSSLIHLVLISGERYLAMKHTFAYDTGLVTEARLLIGSTLAWLFSLILQITRLFDRTRFFIIHISFIGLCLAIIIFCQITVCRVVLRHEKEIASQQVTEEARQKILNDKKAFKLTALVVSVLFLCYLPLCISGVVVINFRNNISTQMLYAGLFAASWVTILNSLLNPLIYSVRMRQFRVAFIELICKTANIVEAEEIKMRVFRSPKFEAGQGRERDQQNAEQANVNNTNNDSNDILPQNEIISNIDKNSGIRKPVQRRHTF